MANLATSAMLSMARGRCEGGEQMAKRHAPIIKEETVICEDCLLPFRRIVGSRRILCQSCSGHTYLSRLKADDEEPPSCGTFK